MKQILLSLAFFAILGAHAQDDSLWVKVRSMGYNGTEDRWVRKGSDADLAFREGLPRIHDTIYIDSFRNKVFALAGLLDHLKKAAPKGSPVIETGGSSFWISAGSWITMKADRAPKKKKRRRSRPDRYWSRAVRVNECPLDTVYGRLIYNLKAPSYLDGNTQDSGYWVGCGKKVNVLPSGDYMLPGKYFRTDEYMDGHTEFKIVDNGKFYDIDDTHIGNYRVYGLVFTPK